MSLVARLARLLSSLGDVPARAASERFSDERLAALALLVHVARIDGVLGAAETALLIRLADERLGFGPAEAGELVRRAESLDREVDDVADLVEMLGHESHAPDRRRLLAMAYGVAGADGVVSEFEDDLLWRMGHLLGFGERDIEAIRGEAAGVEGPTG